MSNCTSIDPLVTPYVDGELSAADRTLVDEHLHRCPPCYSRVAAEGAVRDLVRARKPDLTARAGVGEPASAVQRPDADEAARPPRDAGDAAVVAAPRESARGGAAPWHLRVAPLALTASLVLLVGGAFLYQATHHSSRLLAAELAADHVKCFAANSLLGTHDAPAAVESSMLSAFGWQLHLPEQFDASGWSWSARAAVSTGKARSRI